MISAVQNLHILKMYAVWIHKKQCQNCEFCQLERIRTPDSLSIEGQHYIQQKINKRSVKTPPLISSN